MARFENKRSRLNDQLDHLYDLTAAQIKNLESLKTLVSEIFKILKSLHMLVPKEDLGDCILAHRMSKLLDKLKRNAWETSRMNITKLSTFEEFETFLIARVRALEIAADTPAGSHKPSSSPTSKVIKAHHSSSSRFLLETARLNESHSLQQNISTFMYLLWGTTFPRRVPKLQTAQSLYYDSCATRHRRQNSRLSSNLVNLKLGQRRNHPFSRFNSTENLIYSINFTGNCIGMV